MATTHKRLLVLVLGAMAGMLVAASAAYACASLATLKLDNATAAVGTTVDGRGDSFRDGDGFTPVTLHLETRDGDVLWSGTTENRTINFSFTVPDVEPGVYALVGVQKFVDGRPAAGTPARTTLEITPAGGASAASAVTETSPAAAPVPAAPAQEAAPAAAVEAPAAATQTQAAAVVEPAPAAPAAAAAPAPVTPAAPAPAPQETAATALPAAAASTFPAELRAGGTTLAAETVAFPVAARAGTGDVAAPAAAPAATSSWATSLEAALSGTAAAWLLAGALALGLGAMVVSRRRPLPIA